MQKQDSMGSQSQQAVSVETVSADFGTRLVALLIDGAIIGVPAIILMMILPVMLIYPLLLVASVGYQIYFWTTTGQTFGKQLMGLKVVSAETGALLEPSAALLRYVGYFVSGIALGLGYLWVLWDPKHDAWHDKIAKTKVIKVVK